MQTNWLPSAVIDRRYNGAARYKKKWEKQRVTVAAICDRRFPAYTKPLLQRNFTNSHNEKNAA